MPNQPHLDRETLSACVADLRHLCAEFQAAISALAADDVAGLEAAVATQEKLADKLQSFFHGNKLQTIPTEVSELINLTRVYSALLQKAMRSVRLRSALCRTYKQSFSSPAGEPASATSWSCEV